MCLITIKIHKEHFGNPKKAKTTFCSKGCEFKCRNREIVKDLVVLTFPKKAQTKTEMSEKVQQKKVNRNSLMPPPHCISDHKAPNVLDFSDFILETL